MATVAGSDQPERTNMDDNMKEVEFFKYCGTCKYSANKAHEDPCNECLEFPARYGTEKPFNYEKSE